MIKSRYLKAAGNGLINFYKDDCIMIAGSLTFFSMMAIIPFCLLLFASFNYILGANEEFYNYFVTRLEGLFPEITSESIDRIKNLLFADGIGTITLILYSFQSYQLFLSLEYAMHIVFKVNIRRHFFISVILSFGLVTWIIFLMLASFAASSAIAMLMHFEEVLYFLKIDWITGFLIGSVVPTILIFVAVASLYLIIPKKRVRFKNAFAGALLTTIFLEAAKFIFTLILGKVLNLGVIYGSLSVSIIFLLWIFYSWCIFLIGAEMVHLLEK